jgi:hypothetical protein
MGVGVRPAVEMVEKLLEERLALLGFQVHDAIGPGVDEQDGLTGTQGWRSDQGRSVLQKV